MDFEEISEVVPWIELAHDQGQDLEKPQQGAPPRYVCYVSMCVCVCERERECVCVCVARARSCLYQYDCVCVSVCACICVCVCARVWV